MGKYDTLGVFRRTRLTQPCACTRVHFPTHVHFSLFRAAAVSSSSAPEGMPLCPVVTPVPFVVPTSRYYSTIVPCIDVNSVQPFGWLGGAAALMRALTVQVMFSRINYDYTLRSIQNCQVLVLTSCLSDDTFVSSVERTTARLRESHQTAATHQLATPKWLTKMGNGGTYGALYATVFAQLHAQQCIAAEVERDVIASRATAGQSASTGLSGFATVQYEVAVAGSSMRYLNSAEWREVLDTAKTCWDTQLAEFKRKPATTDSDLLAAMCTVQTQHVTAETARAQRLYDSAVASAPDAAQELGVFSVPEQFLHMTLLCGHPGRPGVGLHTLQRVCALADALSRGVLLSAVNNGLTLTYYAKLGFRAVVWVVDKPKPLAGLVQAQGWVYMWRPPRSAGTGADVVDPNYEALLPALLSHSSTVAYHVESDKQQPDGRQNVTVTQRVTFPPRKEVRGQAEYAHLSTEAEELLFKHVVMKGDKVSLSCSWAYEMLRLLREKRTWVGCPIEWRAGAEVPDPDVVLKLSGTKRGRPQDATDTPRAGGPSQPASTSNRGSTFVVRRSASAGGQTPAAPSSSDAMVVIPAPSSECVTAGPTPRPPIHLHFAQPGTYTVSITYSA